MQNLYFLRTSLDINPGALSKLLNITAHTYLLYEKGIIPIPFEIIKMLSVAFNVDDDIITDGTEIPEETIISHQKMCELTDDEIINVLTKRILPNGEKLNYRNIRKVKNRVSKYEKNEKSEP